MPFRTETPYISPSERRREVAAILVLGVLRWRDRTRIGGIAPTPDGNSPQNGLELSGETRISASGGTPRVTAAG